MSSGTKTGAKMAHLAMAAVMMRSRPNTAKTKPMSSAMEGRFSALRISASDTAARVAMLV